MKRYLCSLAVLAMFLCNLGARSANAQTCSAHVFGQVLETPDHKVSGEAVLAELSRIVRMQADLLGVEMIPEEKVRLMLAFEGLEAATLDEQATFVSSKLSLEVGVLARIKCRESSCLVEVSSTARSVPPLYLEVSKPGDVSNHARDIGALVTMTAQAKRCSSAPEPAIEASSVTPSPATEEAAPVSGGYGEASNDDYDLYIAPEWETLSHMHVMIAAQSLFLYGEEWLGLAMDMMFDDAHGFGLNLGTAVGTEFVYDEMYFFTRLGATYSPIRTEWFQLGVKTNFNLFVAPEFGADLEEEVFLRLAFFHMSSSYFVFSGAASFNLGVSLSF